MAPSQSVTNYQDHDALVEPMPGNSEVCVLDPLRDSRWMAFLARHPSASVFHTAAWLQALRRTYGYRPLVYTTTRPGMPLSNGVVFCKVDSWLTGTRLVSLPFSDHCQPLADDPRDLPIIFAGLQERFRNQSWKYMEVRPLSSQADEYDWTGQFGSNESYCLHTLDLRPNEDVLFRNFHKSCIQRKIQRAEREGLKCEAGRSEAILKKFYSMLLLTRRRHQLPPQPMSWFRNLIRSLGDKAEILIALKDSQPVAGILTLSFKQSLVYKYGCSDARFHNLGGTLLVLWNALQNGKKNGAVEFDLGRSELDNPGLIAFKGHWGAQRFPLTYYRYPSNHFAQADSDWRTRIAKQAFSRMPDSLLAATGRLLYRHIG